MKAFFNSLSPRFFMKFGLFKAIFVVLLFSPLVLHSSMTGGDFEIYADTFSVIQDGGVSGGSFTLTSTGGEAAGIIGQSATGTIIVALDGQGFNIGETFTLSDGAVTTTFVFRNFAGLSNGTINGGQIVVDTGGAEAGSVAGMTNRVAEAINHPNANLEVQATSDGVDRVYLVNTRTAGTDGNVPMTEAVADASFVVVGMSGGGSTSSGFTLRGGFQAMERASLSMSLDTDTISLGQLALDQVSSGNVEMVVTTDSPTGYTVSLTEDGNLRKGDGAANDIDDVADGTVSAGSEEYGIRTSGAAGLRNDSDVAISGSVSIVSWDNTVTAQLTTTTFKAAIGSNSRAGSYSHIVTFTATANP